MGSNGELLSVPRVVPPLAIVPYISIDCWVHGEDVETVFSVEISRNKTVGALKGAIKDKKPVDFRDRDANSLVLYKVSLPYGKDAALKLKQWDPKGEQKLNGRTKLSELFPNATGSGWVVIVLPGSLEPLAVVPDMSLNCWVRGDHISSYFSVKISSMGTIGDLREAIKNEKPVGFRDVDAMNLALYKVPPYSKDKNFEDVLGALTISSLGDSLHGLDKLLAVFMPLSPDQLHLIVGGLVPLQCWIRGAVPTSSFGVRISANARVVNLKNLVAAVHKDRSPDRLKLYKIPTDDTVKLDEILRSPGSGRLLEGNEYLEKVFDDVLFSRMPRVVVELLEERCSFAAVPSAVHPQLKYIQTWDESPRKSPSEQGEAPNFSTLQLTDLKIEWTRPPDSASTIPATLLHPVFGQFVDDCHTHEPTSDDNSFVLALSREMSKVFANKSQRQEAFIDILRNHSIGMVPSCCTGYHTDGDMHVNRRRYVILEVKSEVGSEGAELYCQAILRYIGASKDEVEKAFEKDVQFNFPCLIVTLFGPHLSFSGAVWANRPSYQILSTVLPLFWHPTDTIMRRSTARHVGAFTKACRSLKELYEKFDWAPGDFKDLQPGFPHPRRYTSLDGKKQVGFRYMGTLEARKLLFAVKTDFGEQLCVKFTRTYAREVHQQCAAWEISPSLRGFDTVPGGWHMVVMDLLEEYECLHDVKHSLSHEQKERLRDELRRKLSDLHQMNLVHGDVRDANVMVSKDRLGWKLVDFDWSGKINEVRYPMNVNRGLGVRRPEDADDGKLILADHDMKMLDYLFQ